MLGLPGYPVQIC